MIPGAGRPSKKVGINRSPAKTAVFHNDDHYLIIKEPAEKWNIHLVRATDLSVCTLR